MRRNIHRAARIGAALAVALSVEVRVAPAAFAKGDLRPTSIAVTITGPGLERPISASWQGSCFLLQRFACSRRVEFRRESQGFPGDLGSVSGAVWTLANDSNFLAQATGSAGGYRAPRGDLGPKYAMRWTVAVAGRAQVIEQALYPWGPGPLKSLPSVPWVYTPPGYGVLGAEVGSGWMPATSVFFQDLVRGGVPATEPAVASQRPIPASPAGDPPAAPIPAPAPGQATGAWAVALGATLLMGLLGVALALGRTGRRVQSAA